MNVFDLQKIIVPKAQMIFDVGAFVGGVTGQYNKMYPEATIYSFEPMPQSYAKLDEKYAHSVNIRCRNIALSNRKGKISLHVNKSPDTSSMYQVEKHAGQYVSNANLIKETAIIQVAATTLDEFCAIENVEHIDILKMDIQGGELAVLQGAKQTFKNKGVSVIYTEVIFAPVYKGQYKFHDMIEYLTRYEFKLVGLFNACYNGDGTVKWADALFAI